MGIRNLLIFLGLIFLFACGDESNALLKKINSNANAPSPEPESIENEESTLFFYPGEIVLPGRILTTGNFHNDEVPEGAGKMEWFGLFKNEKGWYIQETGILINRVKDEIVDGENEKTGWLITTTNVDTCFLLIEEYPGIKSKKVDKILPELTQIWPGTNHKFSFKGINYELIAKGKSKQLKDYLEVSDYELLLKANIGGMVYTDTLVMIPKFNNKFTQILFVGDIDNDRIPDWIIDTSNHDNTEEITLYLSKNARRPKLLQIHASHALVGS